MNQCRLHNIFERYMNFMTSISTKYKFPLTDLNWLSIYIFIFLVVGCGAPSQVAIEPPPIAKPLLAKRELLPELVLEPRNIVRPLFPEKSSKNMNGMLTHFDGWVHVSYAIDEAGQTKKIKLIAESPKGIFTNAAIKAANSSSYQPPRIRGKSAYINHAEMLYSFEHYGRGTVYCENPRYGYIDPKKITNAKNVNQYELIVRPFMATTTIGPHTPVVTYPDYAKQRKLNGQVVVGFKVSSNGDPIDVKMFEESPACIGFGKAALQAVRRINLSPERKIDFSYDREYYLYRFNFIAKDI